MSNNETSHKEIAMQVTFSKSQAPLVIYLEGKEVGSIKPTLTKTKQYVLDLPRIQWRTVKGKKNTYKATNRGGYAVRWCKRLKDAKILAELVCIAYSDTLLRIK